MYTQNNEEQIILDYFKECPTYRVLDIGANDGVTFSNSRALIERGAEAVLVEPSPIAFAKLTELYKENPNVGLAQCAIGTTTGTMTLHDSDEHCGAHGLVSTLVESETQRWTGTQTFTPVEVQVFSWADFSKDRGYFDFISIDAEGMDYDILSQMDLKALNCRMLIVEHNGKETEKYVEYCQQFGMKELARNAENLIMAL
jgi:FkbM family methyltransferase